MSQHRPKVADVTLGMLLGTAAIAWATWELARAAGVVSAPAVSFLPDLGGTRQVTAGEALALPPWVRMALLFLVASAGGLVLAGAAHEASRRLAEPAATTPSHRVRSVAALVFGVATGAAFALVGSLMALAAAGVIAFEDGSAADLPWFLGGIGAFVVVASLLVTYSSLSRWWRGGDAKDRRST